MPAQTPGGSPSREIATLGGGCFWCLEAVFEQLRGVDKVESGYSGGTLDHPNYRHRVECSDELRASLAADYKD